MRNRLLTAAFVATVGLASFAGSCNPPTTPDVTVIGGNQTVTVNGSGGGPTTGASPGANGPCLPVARVGVEVHGADDKQGTITVGSTITLDATPKDAADNVRPGQCDLNDGVSWGVAGPCTVQNGSSFTPQVKGDAVGTCYVTAKVKDITSNAFTLTVNPRPTFLENPFAWLGDQILRE